MHTAFRALPRISTVGRQQARTLGAVAVNGSSSYLSSTLACAAAVAAAVILLDDQNAKCTYGPIATISDIRSVEDRIASLEDDVKFPGRTTNSAFVFVKPAAVTPAACALVEKSFKANGIKITGSGSLDAKTIDKEQLIDTHYGAIASKAVKMQPSELNVSSKAQEQFAKAFGLTWKEALDKGMVYNAMDGCQKMGCKPEALEAKYWSKLTRDKDLIKFGGGFYCGKLAPNVFVINGFYMSMRSVFTTPPATITWYTVEWPSAHLSWEDFRGKVLGATDPSTAEPGSARREIFENWKELKLKAVPNVGDNGVHASASPFEAFAERCNWLGASAETDAFGAAALAAGVSKETLLAYASDPVVPFEGKDSSLFDLLEDMDARACLGKLAKISNPKE